MTEPIMHRGFDMGVMHAPNGPELVMISDDGHAIVLAVPNIKWLEGIVEMAKRGMAEATEPAEED